MYLTTVNRLKLKQKEYNLITEMCHLSKNLYNYTLYNIRQHYINNNKYLNYYEAYHIVKDNENYNLLPSQVSQQTMRKVDQAMKSFFSLLKKDLKPKLPKYLPKDDFYILQYTKAHFKVLDTKVRLTVNKELLKKHNLKSLLIDIPPHIIGREIKEIRINPLSSFLKVEFVYFDNNEYESIESNDNFLSIDLGVNNLISMIDNVTNKPTIICGREIKSINQLFNKRLSNYQSLAKKINNIYSTKRIKRLYEDRSNKLNDRFHKISNYIIDYSLTNNISTIYIGYNLDWKQNINIGKKNNQIFTQIPYTKLINYLEYKAKRHNIDVIITEESYTSKVDSLALESLDKQTKYKGTRVKRGLYKSSVNKLINADINASINIARKCKGKDLNDWILNLASSGTVDVPLKVRVPH